MKIIRTEECPCDVITYDDLEVGDVFKWEHKPETFIKCNLGPLNRRSVTLFCVDTNTAADNPPPKSHRQRPVIKLCAELVVAEDKS